MLGLGKLVGSHVLLTSFTHSIKVVVRLVSCCAPALVEEPAQVRPVLLPPPISISFLAIGSKAPFFNDFLEAIFACFSTLVFCFSKFATTSFHLLIMVVALSKHFPSTDLSIILLLFILAGTFFFLKFFLLFFLTLLFFFFILYFLLLFL